ncbi:aconitase family protein [Bosea vaviloviae]|uniref:aconitase family protein n=1 Tax=Bosea vaviloviae TaxID=1526658 RepID=UPI003CC7B089
MRALRTSALRRGSCTAGKRDDFDQDHEVWAAERGLKVPGNATFYLQFGTLAVRRYCEERGYLAAFRQVGAELLNPACGRALNAGSARRQAATRS